MQNGKSKISCPKTMPSRTEIVTAISNDVCLKAEELRGGSVIKRGSLVVQFAGGFTNVFPFIKKDGRKVAVRCWCADIDSAKERCSHVAEYLKDDTSGYFVDFQYVPDAILVAGALHPVVIMEWVEGSTLKKYIDEQGPSKRLFLDLAEKFRRMVEYLHSKNISHGDLQHGNIMIKPDGSLTLIDYDSMYVDSLKGMTDAVKGLPGYQHPARTKNRLLTPKSDYFSELVIYLSLNIFAEDPSLWKDYVDTEDLLFSKEDFDHFRQSDLFKVYGSCSNQRIRSLMKKMEEALSVADIEGLLPLEAVLDNKTGTVPDASVNVSGIISKLDSFKPATAPHSMTFPDAGGIIANLNTLMEAIELNKQIPAIDINKIISKLQI